MNEDQEVDATEDSPGTPAPEAGQPGTFSLPDTWKNAGFDFENTDPAQAREALEFHSRYRGKKVYGEDEVDSYAQRRLTELLSNPQGQEQLEAYLKAMKGQRQPEGAENQRLDPMERRLRQMEQAQATLLQAARQTLADQERTKQEQAMKVEYDRVEKSLSKAINATPGAEHFNEGDWLVRRFWQDVMTHHWGKDKNPTEGDVRKWVKDQVDFINRGFSRKRQPPRNLNSVESNVDNKKLEEMSLKDRVHALAVAKGLKLDGDED